MVDGPFNPEMLTLARESRRYTQKDLERETGIRQSQISRYESGTLLPSQDTVCKLARALDYPVRFFAQRDIVYGLGSSFVLHRKRQSMPAMELRRIQAEVNVARIRVERLLREIDCEAQNAFITYEVDEDGTPEEIAQKVRVAWKLPAGPVRDLTRAVESTGAIVVSYPFDNKKIDGLSLWVPPTPPLFFLNDRAPADRTRWTLAHELAHAVLHRYARPEIEEEADRFASEFLLPAADIGDELHNLTLAKAAMLKLRWRVSIQALIRRAKDLEVISDKRYRSLCVQVSRAGIRMHEPNPIPPEEPRSLQEILRVHEELHGYGLNEVSDLALASPSEFRRLFKPARASLRLAR